MNSQDLETRRRLLYHGDLSVSNTLNWYIPQTPPPLFRPFLFASLSLSFSTHPDPPPSASKYRSQEITRHPPQQEFHTCATRRLFPSGHELRDQLYHFTWYSLTQPTRARGLPASLPTCLLVRNEGKRRAEKDIPRFASRGAESNEGKYGGLQYRVL